MPELKQAEPVEPKVDHLFIALTDACKKIGLSGKTPVGTELLTEFDPLNVDLSIATILQIHEFEKPLNEIIVKDDRFPGSSVRMLRNDGGACGFYPNFVSSPLVRRALQIGSASAIEWLEKVLNTTAATGKTIQMLWGVPVGQEIQLTPEVKIVPIDKVPDSKNKQRLTQDSFSQSSSPIYSTLNFTIPPSALMMDGRIEPFAYDPEKQPDFQDDAYLERHDLLLDIALALIVVGPREVISAAKWFTCDDPDLEYAQPDVRSSQMLEILPTRHADYPQLEPIAAQKVVQGYLALPGKTRDKVRVALKRLNQAQRRHNVGDRAVELSTAFEALLGDGAKTEMTHKIKVRSVRLLGGTDEVRKKNAAVIYKAYDIRSQLVHTGRVDAAKTETVCGHRMMVSEIIDNTITMCADLIKLIIERGSIPDWSIFDITEQT